MKQIDGTLLQNPVTSSPDSRCPAISVIIPLYNAEKHISECLESVLNQTFQNFEVIVVDDCSTDRSLEIVKSYVPKFDGRLRLAKTETNSGSGALPRNIGLGLASGEYVIFVDADDFILLNALETFYNMAKKYNAEVVYTGAHYRLSSPTNLVLYRDEKGEKLIRAGLKDKPDLRVNNQKANLNQLLLEEKNCNFSEPWSKFIKRKFLIKNGIYFPQKATSGGDFTWIINVYRNAKRFLRIPTPLYFYRAYHTTSVGENFVRPTFSESVHPSVSVIIPLYNAEEYIGECLDSLLAQTFQNFEVIVVDDCSSDNSVKIVESYAPKFNGRLTLAKMEKNTGFATVPRNKGMQISCGEYLQFLDADDMLTKTALEEMYKLAKDYDADVVYCEKHYCTDADGTNIRVRIFQKGSLVDEPTLESEDFAERIEKILESRFALSSCFKFVRRKFLMVNELFFPQVSPSEDDIWTYALVFCAKRFLRVPNAIYICRLSENLLMRAERTPQQTNNFRENTLSLGLKAFDNFMNRHEFFRINPSRRYALLKKFVDTRFWSPLDSSKEPMEEIIYSTIREDFGENLGEYDVLILALCSVLDKEKEVLRKFAPYFTARLDIKLIPETSEGDFQILFVSDTNAKVTKPAWLQKKGVGYKINSIVGGLVFVAKSTVNGQIQLQLKGNDVRDLEDNSKRIPHWIDYTKLAVNEQTIFDTLTPAWHDKPYRHNMKVKADEEITIEVEWLPHRSDT